MHPEATSRRVSGHVHIKQRTTGPVFYGKYRAADGRQRNRRLGPAWTGRGRPPHGYLTKRTAQQALEGILADLRRGGTDGASRSGATFRDASAEYLRYVEHDRGRRPSTVTDYGFVVGQLDAEFGDLALEAVTPARIEEYRARTVAAGAVSPRTINKRLVVLHGVFRRAMSRWGLPANPVADPEVDRQPSRPSGDFAFLDSTEVGLLARAAETEQDAALFTVAAFTGLRLGELRALRWRDVDFTGRVVHVRRAYTRSAEQSPKSGKVRSVPLVDQAARALDGLSRREEWTAVGDLVFPDAAGGHFDDDPLRDRFYTALSRAGIERDRGTGKLLVFHDLRHSFGTLAVQVFPLSDVQAYMGHAHITTTMIYVHHVPRHDAADRLSRALDAAAGNPLPDAGSGTPWGHGAIEENGAKVPETPR